MKQSRTFWFWLFMAIAVLVSLLALRGKVAFAHEPDAWRFAPNGSGIDSTI